MSDPVADMLTRIRNGQNARLYSIESPNSLERQGVLSVLKGEGYIKDYKVLDKGNNKSALQIELKYDASGSPVIKELNKISKPGRRVYSGISDLKKFYNGLGVIIVSTSQGIMSDHDARDKNIGGEILCAVF